ncbi:MAG: FHA domain-containing protein [Anaerolineae bacterium]|nr:FHA domain-containing protein [Anaerolineae bacterium]
MEKIIELWYLNYVALVVPAIVLIVTGYIWYAARQQNIQASLWLAIGLVSLALTLPAAWTTLHFQEEDKQLLQSYLEGRAEFSEQFGENITQAFETIAAQLGLTEEIGVDYQNLEWFLYLSLAGLVGSIISVIGYFQSARQAVSVASPAPFYGGMEPTMGAYPPTQPQVDFSPPTPQVPGSFPVDPTAQMSHPVTEQIGMGGGGMAGPGLVGQVGSAPPKTELLNAVPTTVNAWFVVKEGSRAGKLYHLSPEATTIGRDPSNCDIVLDDTAISRQHVKIRQSKGQDNQDVFTLFDLATANGTKVNGADVSKQVLQDNDEVSLGRTVLVFKQMK